MKENKNIERLFQEKFKDFEAMPPQDAWSNIEARLENKKKKRRVIPFWFKASGVAAVLVIGIWLYNQNRFNTIDKTLEKDNSVVNTNEKKSNTFQNVNDEINNNESSFESKVKLPEYHDNYINSNEVVTEVENSTEKFDNNSDKSISEPTIKTNKNSSVQQKINTEKEQVAFESSENRKDSKINQNKGLKTESENKELLLVFDEVENDKEKLADNKKGSELDKNNKVDFNNKNEVNQNNLILEQEDNLEQELITTTVQEDNNNGNFLIENEVIVQTNDIDTLKINEALVEINEVSKDSIQVIVDADKKEENELEKLLKEKEEGKNADEKEEEKRNRWVVSTNAAPIYFNSLQENASPLDDQFASSSKSYNNSISYGVGVEYNLTKRLAVRSGVNKFQTDYDTENVYYTTLINPDVSSARMKSLHVERRTAAENVMLYKKSTALFVDVDNFSNDESGSLNQQIGYIEVPLELSYKVLDKRFGIDVIGGMSTLFLQENLVSLKTNEFQMRIGEANNLNEVNFSGNFGLGFRYSFWKSFNANFQPMLKYQFNTFSENSGNFKPYIVGLYTGLSYSF